jgi:hypothetical protein
VYVQTINEYDYGTLDSACLAPYETSLKDIASKITLCTRARKRALAEQGAEALSAQLMYEQKYTETHMDTQVLRMRMHTHTHTWSHTKVKHTQCIQKHRHTCIAPVDLAFVPKSVSTAASALRTVPFSGSTSLALV